MAGGVDWGVVVQASAAVVQAIGSIWAIRTATRIGNRQAEGASDLARRQAEDAAHLARVQFENAARISREEISATDRRLRREQARRVADERNRRAYVRSFFVEHIEPLRSALLNDKEQAEIAIEGGAVEFLPHDTQRRIVETARELVSFLDEMTPTFSGAPATALALYKLRRISDPLSKGFLITIPSNEQRIASAESRLAQLGEAVAHL